MLHDKYTYVRRKQGLGAYLARSTKKKMASIILLINAVLSDKIGSLISMNPSLNKFSSRPKAFIRKDIRINRLPNKGKIIYLM